MTNKKATLVFRHKQYVFKEGRFIGIVEMKIYLIEPRDFYSEGVKYSLTFAKYDQVSGEFDGNYLRYDNYKGHGHHKHIKGKTQSYKFRGIRALIEDFLNDFENLKEEL